MDAEAGCAVLIPYSGGENVMDRKHGAVNR